MVWPVLCSSCEGEYTENDQYSEWFGHDSDSTGTAKSGLIAAIRVGDPAHLMD